MKCDFYSFDPARPCFELNRDFIGKKLLTKFHEDRTINVASRVFTNKCGRTDGRTDDGQRPVTKAHLSNGISTDNKSTIRTNRKWMPSCQTSCSKESSNMINLPPFHPLVGPNSTVCGPSMGPHVPPWMDDGVLDLPSPAAIGFWNLVK
ncbi:hypothetical protein DPMN_183289 [Dreissena polymorpha]|uniref:Uncharacterized protein n=1 Tax=Dreissena polymorpha TaxID=45954 RepID=A0A9D4DH49_DREPO|nr:hypothetical protein DPMN_183289 [Dreissena polymorpha]